MGAEPVSMRGGPGIHTGVDNPHGLTFSEVRHDCGAGQGEINTCRLYLVTEKEVTDPGQKGVKTTSNKLNKWPVTHILCHDARRICQFDAVATFAQANVIFRSTTST